jgi:iron complex outermembrane receptor protein
VLETFDASVGQFIGAFDQKYRVNLFTQETRLSHRETDGSGWVAGIAAIDSITRLDRRLSFESLPQVPTTFGVRNRVTELTLFGEMTLALKPWLLVTGGGRISNSWLAGNQQNSRNGVDFPRGQRISRRELRALPSLAFVLEPLSNVSTFVRYQQSYRPGGIALRGQIGDNFESDRLTAVEWGMRYRPDGSRATLALTFAATRWTDIQADSIDPNGFPVTGNIGDGRILSAGLTGRWQASRAVDIEGALYLNDSRVTRVSPFSNQLEVRGPLPNVAKVAGRIAVDYKARIGADWQLNLNASMRYVGQSRLGVGPRLGRLQGNYFDSGIEARIGTDRIGFSLSLTNLLDSRGSRFALGSPFLPGGIDKIVPMQPRAVRLGFDTHF